MNIRHAVLGKGKKTLVVVPGLSLIPVTDDPAPLAQAFSAFLEDYTVYVFDVRDDVPLHYTIAQMGEDLVSVIRCLGLRDIALYGCSMGGMVSLYIAGSYPKLVKSLVVGASALHANETSCRVMGEWIRMAKNQTPHALVADMSRLIYTPEIYEANKDMFIAMADGLTEELLMRFANTATAIYYLDVTAQAAAVTCPVLVLGSKGDRVLTAAASEQIAAVTGGTLYLYEADYPHAVYDLAPDFRDRVKSFFDMSA